MKNKIIFFLTLSALTLASCDNWLDVSPKAEIKADKLFETEAGFKDALVGIYIGLTDQHVYGANLSWEALEFLACQYQTPNGKYAQLQKYNYDYDHCKNLIHNIWAKQYNIIAEINYLLQMLEEKGKILHPVTYDVIKGECLALRAMCHFDLVRLYAPGNLAKNPGNLSKKCIPYVIEHSKNITEQKTYREVLNLIHQDLNNALSYLESDPLFPDPITRPDDYEAVTRDVFFSGSGTKKRETRLSYPAVLLLQARVYHWEGNASEALQAAEQVIAAFDLYVRKGEKIWATESEDVSTNDGNKIDRVFNGELLFALDVRKLNDYMINAYTEHINNTFNNDRLAQPLDFVRDIFSFATGEANSDLRYLKQYSDVLIEGEAYRLTTKISKTQGTHYANIIPLIRISEAYLIAAENLIETNKKQAVGYMNYLKEKRNIPPTYYLKENISDSELMNRIVQEYRKEFTQEGQLFYCYKRLGLKTFPGIQFLVGEMTDAQYTFPYPEIELELGQREELIK